MHITTSVATITVDKKSTELTRRVFNQLPFFKSGRFKKEEIQFLGTVDNGDALYTLINTPEGAVRSHFYGEEITGPIPRIILLK